ncbi:hypothetical protein [Weeksella virosa]|uniref:Lipoprotein n=1 Tax=Weeksella virosa (strain ATCC 43766 / DSM 16922 / JCM 21250 / CCUG 30538 / CDC 9751 / IAM 14551 / NBRC 16016 / NCTC 11634 / CL345/78) TaxID=865938 RepID=F0P0M6_WEEVC|nr:hypothetical protein [Weeksella virosa]ADX68525.1 hypothetical protein Weevi_1836 [Weeksella virosa DSM 16922]MDK7675303.1 hypothetical protein [Weeksella virosa]SUP54860.1 Uncharacterised protein [Weeksella virosa]VEH63817.1 Uncharacterised protein [Weeksella virosa]
MKKHYLKTFFFYLFLAFIFSCSSDDIKNKNSLQDEINSKAESSIIGKKIASIKNGNIRLLASDTSINKGVKNLIDPSDQNNISYNRSTIVNIDNMYYLRSYSNDGLVTTTLLEEEEESNNGEVNLLVAGISCTSKACSGTNGCVPNANKKSCSSCLGDCTKTVTSVEYEEEF